MGFWDSTKRTYVVDDNRISNFNCYKTQEIAQQEAKWLRAARKLRALARELNPDGWKPDWRDINQYKGRFVHQKHLGYYIGECDVKDSCIAHFHTEEAAQTALDQLTEDEREVLFG